MAKLSKLTDRKAVTDALAEYDRVGRTQFLHVYGFGRARDYFIRVGDRYYDSKPIVAAAYGNQYRSEGALTFDQFSGGKLTVKKVLERLDFSVVTDPYRCLVLTENEVYASPRYDKVAGRNR